MIEKIENEGNARFVSKGTFAFFIRNTICYELTIALYKRNFLMIQTITLRDGKMKTGKCKPVYSYNDIYIYIFFLLLELLIEIIFFQYYFSTILYFLILFFLWQINSMNYRCRWNWLNIFKSCCCIKSYKRILLLFNRKTGFTCSCPCTQGSTISLLNKNILTLPWS